MSTVSSIELDYSQVMAQVKKLESCTQTLKSAEAKLNALPAELQAGWSGESAALYLQKCEELNRKLQKLRASVQSIADTIETAAVSYRNAELEAIADVQTTS